MKYLKFILPVVCYLFVNTISAQVGNNFPTVVGESLTNEVISIPKDTKGKYSIVGMAWSKKGEEELEDWFVPVFDLFVDKESFIPTVYDVNSYYRVGNAIVFIFYLCFQGLKKEHINR